MSNPRTGGVHIVGEDGKTTLAEVQDPRGSKPKSVTAEPALDSPPAPSRRPPGQVIAPAAPAKRAKK